jgi:multidrug transporter EmrE-like cation transporter
MSYQYFYAFYLASIDAIALSLLKLKHNGLIKGGWVLPLTMFIYSTQPIAFYTGLSIESMTILNLLWDVISDVIVTFIGLYFLNEKISLHQSIGIVFCLIGIILLGIK